MIHKEILKFGSLYVFAFLILISNLISPITLLEFVQINVSSLGVFIILRLAPTYCASIVVPLISGCPCFGPCCTQMEQCSAWQMNIHAGALLLWPNTKASGCGMHASPNFYSKAVDF